MLESIGGIQGVSKTYADPSRRLELRFRPQDPFCHPVCGNRFPSTNLLLRMKRRVRKGNPKEAQINMDILGVIGTTYKFQGMADFQYLAVHSAKDGSHTPSTIRSSCVNQRIMSSLSSRCPSSFLHPSSLAWTVLWTITTDLKSNTKKAIVPPTNIPTEPLEAAKVNWKRVCVHPSDIKAEEQLKKMFESRPIWSGYAVKANLDIHPDKLKLLLPIVAYYMVTGPWRSLWVRFGYDPCKTPEAKKYQVLDFRIRCSTKHGYTINDMPVKAKRSTFNYTLPITVNKAVPQAANVTDLPPEGPAGGRSANITRYQLKDSSYIFRDGTLPPPQADVLPALIRNVISRNDGQEKECDERDGWCLSHTSDDLRDIMSSMIKQVIRAKRPAPYSSGPESSVTRRKTPESGEEDDEEEDEEDEFHPSEGSDNEMQTEMLDYM
ncbi:hypothetical protein J4Q44_G00241290 [Coregonus suidteri]|uniref:General transcription factor IIIC, polypeptide 5 n=1 Tax=Coregonus suidteri TaxID=861788 RepID=A0AAN8L249_9TELE